MAVLTEAIEAEGEAGAAKVTGTALVETATETTIVAVIIIAVADEPALALVRPMMTGITDQAVHEETIAMTIGAMAAATVITVDAPQVQDAAANHQSPPKMSVTGVPFLCSSLQLG